MYQDAESGGTIDKNGQRKPLFTLDEVNEASKNRFSKIRNAFYASYPYSDVPLVLLRNDSLGVRPDYYVEVCLCQLCQELFSVKGKDSAFSPAWGKQDCFLFVCALRFFAG